MEFKDLNLLDIGNNIQLSGMIMSDRKNVYFIPLPEEVDTIKDLKRRHEILELSLEEFKQLSRQMDIQETEICTSGNKKMIVRKSQRQIDAGITWKVFQRDNYTCRYCGITGVPMTYDHIKLWEKMGDTTIENGVCACKKCNKTRGNMEYKDWINSKYYLNKCSKLPYEFIKTNQDLLKVYESFEDRKVKKSR